MKAVRYQKDGVETRIETDAVWSTLPLTTLVSLHGPARAAGGQRSGRRASAIAA